MRQRGIDMYASIVKNPNRYVPTVNYVNPTPELESKVMVLFKSGMMKDKIRLETKLKYGVIVDIINKNK